MYKLKTNPWRHQWKALDYAMTHDAAAIFTDMGSGKTKIMIDLIVNRSFHTVLIVGTKKSCDVWETEFQKHSNIPKNFVYNLSGVPTTKKLSIMRETLRSEENSRVPVVFIMNYEAVWREPLKPFLYKQKFDCVICDESHRIKTPRSKVNICMSAIGRGYVVLDEKEPYINLDMLKKRMYKCAFYAQSDVELPKVTHIYFDQYLSPEAQDIYIELNKEGVYEDESGIVETNNILAKYTRLQQLLSGYLSAEDETFTDKFLVEKDHTKAEALEYILENIPKEVAPGEKTKTSSVCKTLGRTYGEISGEHDDYKSWKKGQLDIVAVQYSSGSESISLVEARYCIYYSHTFSYGQYQQSIKRTHRPGQKRPVTYYHIISKVKGKQTVDDKIKKALSLKQSLSEYILQEKQGRNS